MAMKITQAAQKGAPNMILAAATGDYRSFG
jgi:hypothetical protein